MIKKFLNIEIGWKFIKKAQLNELNKNHSIKILWTDIIKLNSGGGGIFRSDEWARLKEAYD